MERRFAASFVDARGLHTLDLAVCSRDTDTHSFLSDHPVVLDHIQSMIQEHIHEQFDKNPNASRNVHGAPVDGVRG